MLIEIGRPLIVAGSDFAVVRFGEQARPDGSWAGRRILRLGEDAGFLLDGHHKFDAAAAAGRPLQVLSLLAVGASLATREQVDRV